jgi:hypothetical protein
MAELFRMWKKRLWAKYLEKKTPPVFEGYLAKQAAHWPAFKAYKESEEAEKLREKNKKNADKKQYHHKMGPGGYETAVPKWDKKEAELQAKGIMPEWKREGWELRARNWFLGHGASYDEETGDIVCGDGIRIPRENWLNTMKAIKDGTLKFKPDREKDMLTLVLGNDEKPGRTRGFGPKYPWSLGFAKDIDTYRSRERAKKRKAEEEGDMLNQLKARIDNQQQQIDELKLMRQGDQSADRTLELTVIPSQRRSSVADSEVPADSARVTDGGPGYPVDGIIEKTPCQLHQKMANLSVKVAVGYALPCTPGARWHGRDIQAGYARVGVDEVVHPFESLELEIHGAEGETTLGEVKGGIILWAKEYIKFAGSAPWTTAPPPSSRRKSPTPPPSPQRSPPPEYDHHSASPSRSPLPDLGRSPSPPPPPAKETKRKRVNNTPSMSSNRRSPKRKQLSPLPKVPHQNIPVLAAHRTDEQRAAISKAEVATHFAKKVPEPKPVYTEKQTKYAIGFLNTPKQYDLHDKPDEYTRTLAKQMQKKSDDASGSNDKSASKRGGCKKRSDVPQLGQQAKQSIPPLKVLDDAQVLPQIDMQAAAALAAEMGVSIAELLSSQDDNLPKATVVPEFKVGMPFVTPEEHKQLPTAMRRLHNWYLQVAKQERIMIVLKVPEEYYFRPETIHVEFSELNQLYKFWALDKSIMSCYCL